MQYVWKHPSLTGIEIAWRWVFGAPLLLWVWLHSDPVVRSDPQSWPAVASHAALGWQGPSFVGMAAAAGLLLVWCLWSAAGRTVLLRKLGAAGTQWGPVAVFTVLRVFLFAAVVVLWLGALTRIARGVDWTATSFAIQVGLVPKFAMAVGATLVLFLVWSLLSWRFSLPLAISAADGVGVNEALRRLRGQREVISKTVEINFVMGIVKVALLVLAVTFSACPLPFQAISTPDFLAKWWTGVAVLYLAMSDLFHVVRLASGLELWRSLKSPAA